MVKFHCRLTAFLRSIYLVNLDQFSPAIPTLRRQKNNSNCLPLFFSLLQSNASLARCKKISLAGPLVNKYRVQFYNDRKYFSILCDLFKDYMEVMKN